MNKQIGHCKRCGCQMVAVWDAQKQEFFCDECGTTIRTVKIA